MIIPSCLSSTRPLCVDLSRPSRAGKARVSRLHPGLCRLLGGLDRGRRIRMVGQLIAMGMGMCVVPGRKSRLLLRLMCCLGMRMVHGVMLVFLTLPVFIRAILGPGLGGLGIIGLAIGSVSWRHSQYFRYLLLKQSHYRSYEN
jgi:hypothetical protein